MKPTRGTKIEESYNVTSGSSVSIERPINRVNADIVRKDSLRTAYLDGNVNTVVTFNINNERYQWGYDQDNALPSSDAVYIYDLVGNKAGVLTFSMADDMSLTDTEDFRYVTDTMIFQGKVAQQPGTSYPYVYWITDYSYNKGNDLYSESNLHLLLQMKTEDYFHGFISALSFGKDVSGQGYCVYQKDLVDGFSLSRKSSYFIYGEKMQVDGRYKDSIVLTDFDGNIGFVTFGDEAIDLSNRKSTPFEYTTKTGLKVSGLYFKQKEKGQTYYCYEVGTISGGRAELQGIMLFVMYDKKTFEKVAKEIVEVE